MYTVPLGPRKEDYLYGKLLQIEGNALFYDGEIVNLGQLACSVRVEMQYVFICLERELRILTLKFKTKAVLEVISRFSIASDCFCAAFGSKVFVFANNSMFELPYFVECACAVKDDLYFAFKTHIYKCNVHSKTLTKIYASTEHIIDFLLTNDGPLVVLATGVALNEQLVPMSTRIVRASFSIDSNLLALATVENQIYVYEFSKEIALERVLGDSGEPARCPSYLEFVGPYLIICLEHGFSTMLNTTDWSVAEETIESSPVVDVLHINDLFLLVQGFCVYAFQDDFTPHSIVVSAGCQISACMPLVGGFCTVADEASVRAYVVPGYISGDEARYAGKTSPMSLTIASITKEMAHIVDQADFEHFGKTGDTLWPEVFEAAELSGGRSTGCILEHEMLYCVCVPGRLDENGIEVYKVGDCGLQFLEGIKPVNSRPFVRVYGDGEHVFCSNLAGELFRITEQFALEVIFCLPGFKGVFVVVENIVYAIIDGFVCRVNNQGETEELISALNVFEALNELYIENSQHMLLKLSNGVIICQMSDSITCVRAIKEQLIICDKNAVIARLPLQ